MLGPQAVSTGLCVRKDVNLPANKSGDIWKGDSCSWGVAVYDRVGWVSCHGQKEVRSQNEREGLARAGAQEMFIWSIIMIIGSF